jgi:DNA polymerase IV
MPGSKTIFHLDLDAFFVSVERLNDPALEDKPVIVGGKPDSRGVVAACSYEARKFGVHSAMPLRTAYKLCPHGIYINGSYEEYVRFSRIVRNILKEYAPVLEPASIDEFYIDFTGCEKIYGSFKGLALFLQKLVFDKTGLPCSIGIASNKTIAKIASDFRKPKGIMHVPAGEEKNFLAPLPVQVIPGVGKVFRQKLNDRGFYFIKDITAVKKEYFSTAFGKWGAELWEHANGAGSTELHPEREQKGISKEHTFHKDITDKKIIKELLADISQSVCEELRDKNLIASVVKLKLRYSDFQTMTRQKSIKPSSDDVEIFKTAWELFEKADTRRVAYRLIGAGVTKLSPFSEQEKLFDTIEEKRKRLLIAVDKLRAKNLIK